MKLPVIRCEVHRRYVAAKFCCVCGGYNVQAAHIRMNLAGGMGFKPSDLLLVPLCADGPGREGCHSQCDSGQVKFWNGLNRADMPISPFIVARKLWRSSPSKAVQEWLNSGMDN